MEPATEALGGTSRGLQCFQKAHVIFLVMRIRDPFSQHIYIYRGPRWLSLGATAPVKFWLSKQKETLEEKLFLIFTSISKFLLSINVSRTNSTFPSSQLDIRGVKVSFSHVQLFVTLWTVAHKVPLSMKFSRQEYGSG